MADEPVNLKELSIKVLSSTKKLFDGRANAISSFNKVGPFDVLPMHENFISLIKDKVVILKSDGQKQEIPFERGLMEVSDNAVNVFVGI
jgi:F0F1-type ATP synthase epsilon subunit